LETPDDCADSRDGEHCSVHQVGGVILASNDADGEVDPDEQECRRDRNADREPVRRIERHPHREFTEYAGAEQHGPEGCKVEHIPLHFIGKLHGDQRYKQKHRRRCPARHPPMAPMPGVVRPFCHCMPP